MASAINKKLTFIELAKRVLEKVGKPMTANEIWQYAVKSGDSMLLGGTGKTPEASLGARIYVDSKDPNSIFSKHGARPTKFMLKHPGSIPIIPIQNAEPLATLNPLSKSYTERDIHPLVVWFANLAFSAHCRTIYHEKSIKKGLKQNEWLHPDIVGFALTSKDWSHEVVQLAQNSGSLAARLFSFEVKLSLDFPTLREFFFQAVSNSSWAHEGYLVAVEIDEDPEFRLELTRLSQSFGIGVIQLNVEEPADSTVLLAAREKVEIDWKTVDRIAAVNSDFEGFIGSVAKSIKINQPALNGFDTTLNDDEIKLHLKKIIGK